MLCARRDAQFLQPGQDVAHRKRVVFVRFPAQQVGRYSNFSFCPSLFGILHIALQCFLWKKLKIFFNLFYTGIIACPMRDGRNRRPCAGGKRGERCLDHRYVPGETRRHPVAVPPSPCC